jgi:hypothetical protein
MLTPSNLGKNNYSSAAYFTWTDAAGASHSFYPDLVLTEKWDNGATCTEHPVEQGANVIDHVRVELIKCALTIFATNEPVGANNFSDPGAPQGVALTGPTPSPGVYPTSVQAAKWNSNLTARGIALAAGDLAATAAASAIGGEIGGVAGAATILGAGLLEGLLLPGSASNVSQSIASTPTVAAQVSGVGTVMYFSETQDFVEATIQLLLYLKATTQIISMFGSKQSLPSMVIENVSYTREEATGTGAEITIDFKEMRFVTTQTVSVPLPSLPSAANVIAKGTQNPSEGTPAQQQSVAEYIKSLLLGPSTPSLPGVGSL